jgi:Pentapeptide repeats (9 copies)
MATSPTSAFVCDSFGRSACRGEPFFGEHEGRRFCVLHFPGEAKQKDFDQAFKRKLLNQDFNFQGVWFPTVDFGYVEFTGPADFYFATFGGDVTFIWARFTNGAYFNETTFKGDARFPQARFSAGANFASAKFKGLANFSYAEFAGEVDFTQTTFAGPATFFTATFKDYVRFSGHEKSPGFTDASPLNLQFARVEEPQHFVFHTFTLNPSFFVNIDPRQFEFINVEWRWRSVGKEIERLRFEVRSPHRMLAIACRQLAVNAEENHRYEEASSFRYRAMDARRLEHWGGFDFRKLSWWYWLASGYGERMIRATVWLFAILLICAALYTRVGFVRWEPRLASENDAVTNQRDEMGAPLKLVRALTYSAAVMTLQKPEPKPATTTAQTFVLFETILGPVQAALLALAIRRKFMR